MMKQRIILLTIILVFISAQQAVYAQLEQKVNIYALHEISSKEIKLVKKGLKEYWNCKVIVSKMLDVGRIENNLGQEIIYGKSLLDTLEKYNPNSQNKAILVTSKMLTISENPFSNKEKYLIRGLASAISGEFAIISTHKLKTESDTNLIFQQLLIKTARHEYGHLIGLDHCSGDGCLMNSGYDPERFKNVDYKMCDKCGYQLDSILTQ